MTSVSGQGVSTSKGTAALGGQGKLIDELATAAQKRLLTLLCGARHPERNQAVVIREVLEHRISYQTQSGPAALDGVARHDSNSDNRPTAQ